VTVWLPHGGQPIRHTTRVASNREWRLRRPYPMEMAALIPVIGMGFAFMLPGDTTMRAQSWAIVRQLFSNEIGVAVDWWLLAVVQTVCFFASPRSWWLPVIGSLAGLSHWLFYAAAFGLANPIGGGWSTAAGFAAVNGWGLYLSMLGRPHA
jgi:hypothetical protein